MCPKTVHKEMSKHGRPFQSSTPNRLTLLFCKNTKLIYTQNLRIVPASAEESRIINLKQIFAVNVCSVEIAASAVQSPNCILLPVESRTAAVPRFSEPLGLCQMAPQIFLP